jgi:hypothetical protein
MRMQANHTGGMIATPTRTKGQVAPNNNVVKASIAQPFAATDPGGATSPRRADS